MYSILLWRRGFRQDNRVLYFLLGIGAAFHTTAMFRRGFSLERCPINNLFEATMFIAWTIVASYLAIGWVQRLRFLGAFASPVLFGMGVFALMPALDHREPRPYFGHGWESLHAALLLLAYGAFGLSALAGVMYLTQTHDLKFHKARAIEAFMPSIQRLEWVTRRLLGIGFSLLTAGLLVGALYLKAVRGSYLTTDPFVVYCGFTWLVYLALVSAAGRFTQHGRRLAWAAVGGFTFIMLTFWGVWMFSGLHNRPGTVSIPEPSMEGARLDQRTPR
ncbi:MAG: cytochrome c assembly protein [Pedosphaera sp.]|nr:cytochrome c assembly protein [Pedosphaera sp.]